MIFSDMTPEESLFICYALTVAMYKYYNSDELNYIANFIVALGTDLMYLLAADEYNSLVNSNCKRKNLKDEKNYDERIKILEELILSFKDN